MLYVQGFLYEIILLYKVESHCLQSDSLKGSHKRLALIPPFLILGILESYNVAKSYQIRGKSNIFLSLIDKLKQNGLISHLSTPAPKQPPETSL